MPIFNPGGSASLSPKIKPADSAISDSTTLTLDPDLQAPFAGGSAVHRFEANLIFDNGSNATAPAFAIFAPSGAIARATLSFLDVAATLGTPNFVGGSSISTGVANIAGGVMTETTVVSLSTNTSEGDCYPTLLIAGSIRGNGCAPGSVGVAWAQSGASDTAAVLKAGSSFILL
jgi:hypothetical protein